MIIQYGAWFLSSFILYTLLKSEDVWKLGTELSRSYTDLLDLVASAVCGSTQTTDIKPPSFLKLVNRERIA